MLTIAVTSLLVFGLVYVMFRVYRTESAPLTQWRAELPRMGIQIICGDCCGDQLSPQKTYMDRYGNCARCGGKSYVLASNRKDYAARLMSSRRLPVVRGQATSARVLPFDSSLGARPTPQPIGESSGQFRQRVAV